MDVLMSIANSFFYLIRDCESDIRFDLGFVWKNRIIYFIHDLNLHRVTHSTHFFI